MLAGMISSPSAYSPRNYPENAHGAPQPGARRRWRDQGYITQEEYEHATVQQPDPDRRADPAAGGELAAPYFTSWLRQQLVDRYGAGEAFGGGLQISSTLDLELQRRPRPSSSSTARAASALPPRSSSLDNESGDVLAMVGGPELPGGPVQPGHERPPPAGILLQAVHPDHRARDRATPQSRWWAAPRCSSASWRACSRAAATACR